MRAADAAAEQGSDRADSFARRFPQLLVHLPAGGVVQQLHAQPPLAAQGPGSGGRSGGRTGKETHVPLSLGSSADDHSRAKALLRALVPKSAYAEPHVPALTCLSLCGWDADADDGEAEDDDRVPLARQPLYMGLLYCCFVSAGGCVLQHLRLANCGLCGERGQARHAGMPGVHACTYGEGAHCMQARPVRRSKA